MTVLGLILGIEVAGLAFALFVARMTARHETASAALRRLASALERAARAFLVRQSRQVGLLTLALLAVVFTALLTSTHTSTTFSRSERLFWATSAILLGVASSALTAYASVAFAVRGGLRVLAGARSSLDHALTTAIRLGGAAGLFTEALALLAPLGLFSVLFAVKGGFAMAGAGATALAAESAALLPPFVLGAALTGLVVQRGCSVYHAAGDVGGDVAGERDAGLEHDDPRNPALVSNLVGDHLGVAAASAVDAFASSTAITIACVLLGTRAHGDVLLLTLLPLLVRSFGLIACATGVMVVRSEEAKSPDLSLARGHLSALVVMLAALGTAAHALSATSYWMIFAAGALGPTSAALSAYATRLPLARRRGPLKETLDTLRIGDGATVASGLGAGLESALIPVSLLGASAVGAWVLGSRSGLAGGAELGLLCWLASLAALAPYALAVTTFAAIVDSARGMAGVASTDPESQRRTARLDDCGFGASISSQSYLVLVSAASAVGAALALAGASERPAVVGPANVTTLVFCAALGAALVLSYAGGAARAATRAAREVALEVERQLRGFPREQGVALVPADYTPSYKACEELAAKHALGGGIASSGPYLLLPLLLGVALRLMYRTEAPWLLSDGLAAFVVAGAVTGLGAALVVDGARAALGGARRATRPRGSAPGYSAAVSGDVVADILSGVVGPAANLIGKASAALLLVVAPFLL